MYCTCTDSFWWRDVFWESILNVTVCFSVDTTRCHMGQAVQSDSEAMLHAFISYHNTMMQTTAMQRDRDQKPSLLRPDWVLDTTATPLPTDTSSDEWQQKRRVAYFSSSIKSPVLMHRCCSRRWSCTCSRWVLSNVWCWKLKLPARKIQQQGGYPTSHTLHQT